MFQKLLAYKFELIEETSQFNEDFIKNYNEESNKGYFLEVDVQYPKNYMNFIMTYYFYQKEWKLEKQKSL